jgi:hypothetical protein
MRQENIRRLDVPVDDASVVRCIEAVRNLNSDAQQFLYFERPTLYVLSESVPLEMLHHEKGLVLVFTDIVDGANVRMINRGDRVGFATEALARVLRSGQMQGEHLDRDAPIQALVPSSIHLAHTADAQSRLDDIRTELGAR